METLDAIWTWLKYPENQKVLTLLGTAFAAVVAGVRERQTHWRSYNARKPESTW